MKKTERWKIWTFVGSLFLVAIFVNSFSDRYMSNSESPRDRFLDYSSESASVPQLASQPTASTPVRQVTPEPTREVQIIPEKSPAELAAERAQYIARYVQAEANRVSGKTTVLVAAADANGKPRAALASVIARHVSSDSVHALPSVLTSTFVTDGLLAEAFRDSTSIVGKLDLAQVADVLLLAREKTDFVRNDTSLANVLTANTELEVLAVPVSKRGENQTWTFSSKGAGFSQADALAAAEERIMKQITNGNTIVLP